MIKISDETDYIAFIVHNDILGECLTTVDEVCSHIIELTYGTADFIRYDADYLKHSCKFRDEELFDKSHILASCKRRIAIIKKLINAITNDAAYESEQFW